jgi:hypothetical protein
LLLPIFGKGNERFEILDESASVNIPPGSAIINGKKVTTTQTFNVALDGCGSTGGHGLIYLTQAGGVSGTCNSAGTPAYLTNADHSDEEVIRTYFWREYGASRSDDFSLITTPNSPLAFTLDDGTSTLVGDGGYEYQSGVYFANSGTIIIVGTGLDILVSDGSDQRSATVYVDGDSKGVIDPTDGVEKVYSIASGMPYGTHTIKFDETAAGTPQILKFIVYGPKKPSIPDNAMELGEYFGMADYDGSTATGTAVADNWEMPVGTLSKVNMREVVFVGASWATLMVVEQFSGFRTYTPSPSGHSFEYTFFGTGVSALLSGSAAGTTTNTISIDGTPNASGVVRANITNDGGGAYTVTGITTDVPCRVEFTALPLGKHTIKVANTSGTGHLKLQAFHVITPFHIHKQNTPHVVQNTLAVGSQSILDVREFGDQVNENPISAETLYFDGFAVGSAETALFPLEHTISCLKTSKPLSFNSFTGNKMTSGSYVLDYRLYVDGVYNNPGNSHWRTTNYETVALNKMLPDLSPGFHCFQLHGRSESGSVGFTLQGDGEQSLIEIGN